MKQKLKIQQKNKTAIKENQSIVRGKKNSSLLPIIIAFCLPVLLYLQTINFKLTEFDDNLIISNNISFLSNFGNVFKAFKADAFLDNSSSFYRPVQTLSYMVDIQLSGKNSSWMFHLSNILLLGLIACSLFLLLKKFLIPPKLALLATLIFCTHPLFVSSVAWIPARGDLLLIVLSLISFLFFIDFLQKKKFIYLFLHWAAFSIALFCKETAAFLPFLFILYFFTFNKEKRFEKKYIITILLYAFSGIIWFWLRSKAIGGISTKDDAVGIIPILSNLKTIPESLSKFFLLLNITPIPGFTVLNTLVGLALIALISIIFLRNKERTGKEKLFCLLWFLILMLPAMLFKHPFIDYLDHRFFLPLIGVLLFILFIIPKKWIVKGNIKSSWILIAVIVLLCSFTFIKSGSYSDPMTFYNSAIAHNPNSAIAFTNRGLFKSKKNDFEGAIADYNKAIAISPNYDLAYSNRGCIKLNNLGDYSGAKADFDVAISINNNHAEIYYNRGLANSNLGHDKEAIVDYDRAIALNPKYPQPYCNRGCEKNIEGDFQGAMKDFNKAIELKPDYTDAYNNKGASFYFVHSFQEAIVNFNKAIEIDPDCLDAYYNRAISRYNLKDFKGSIEDCDKALSINPNFQKVLIFKNKVQLEMKK